MRFSYFWKLVVYDAGDGPSEREYIFYICFDPFPGCNWTLTESEFAARVWAEKLIQLDASQFPQWLNRTRVYAKSLDERQVRKPRQEFQMGAGITIWIEMAPPESRLNNELMMKRHVMMLRSEVAAQVEALTAHANQASPA